MGAKSTRRIGRKTAWRVIQENLSKVDDATLETIVEIINDNTGYPLGALYNFIISDEEDERYEYERLKRKFGDD